MNTFFVWKGDDLSDLDIRRRLLDGEGEEEIVTARIRTPAGLPFLLLVICPIVAMMTIAAVFDDPFLLVKCTGIIEAGVATPMALFLALSIMMMAIDSRSPTDSEVAARRGRIRAVGRKMVGDADRLRQLAVGAGEGS